MGLKLTVNQPNLGDAEVEIPGLGFYKNGTYDISEAQLAEYEQYSVQIVPEDDDNPYGRQKIVTTKLVDAVKSMYGVTIEDTDKKPSTPASQVNTGGSSSQVKTNNEGGEA